ncbi:hypothetical protein KO500_11535 [Cellulophaga baltica]|uniref:hypothetical protein n=1 Tax=Cellulophaga TaxID=104264 RepID=UPI001C069C85|nr:MULTISPECIES: hypothetical protein [Cellulophaga]MBU2997071.1 hypothetical protein [Cellulophaga baltica]MDO6768469.1 hypothetical protein [Cellulophaga sp. 1_MG-2023]
MKKYRFKQLKYILSISLLLIIISCSDEDKFPINYDELKVSGGAFASELSTDGSTDIDREDPASSTFTKTYQLNSLEDGLDVTKVDLYVSFSGSLVDADEVLYSSTDTSGSDAEVTLTVNGELLLDALNLESSDLDGGDTFNYRLALTNSEGEEYSTVSANFDNQSADHTFSSTVICILPIIPDGDWVIQMGDSYGDGWQTTTASGGPGITVTLSNGDVFEVGLCPAASTVCINDGTSGTDTITIPTDITSAEWYFPGDFYGEISFTITAPSGNVVATYAEGSAAGVIALNLCDE